MLVLNAKVLGLVLGLLFGLSIFIATNWLLIKGGENVGAHLQLLNQYFFGYSVSFVGSFIGFAYGFALQVKDFCGFCCWHRLVSVTFLEVILMRCR